MTPEGKVKAEIKRILKIHNVYYFMPSGNGYGRSAIADFVCCVNGHFLAIEAKAGHGRPTALQQRELDNIVMAGGEGICVNEDNVAVLPIIISNLKAKDHAPIHTGF